ncbi:MAG: proton-conducting transporter membrane subunit [Chloroflexi bacterium]|nr:proton-conducting transporter membrane subunit [Chloroflexota bacterium]
MEPITILYVSFLLLVAGAIAAAATSRPQRFCSWSSLGFVSAASLCLLYLAIYVFVKGQITQPQPLLSLPGIGASLSIGIDALSALLFLIISIVSFCVTLFSIRYIRKYEKESLLRFYPLLLLLFASIIGVVVIRDMLFFIVFWEMMTLTSWALVVYERESKISIRAGLEYFIATHVATGFIILASVLLYAHTSGPSFDFNALRASFEALIASNPALVHLILASFFIGFVTKAGVLPFGFWLPNAYSAAPSSGSAAFAGVVEKAGIYAIVRVFCTILPISVYSQTWGIVIAIFGTFSIFIGTMSALTQDDSKRLMSFHAIGQIGYMLLGIGVGLYFLPINTALATIALVAGLFHMINHAWFKSCLFLNAGSIFYRTGIRDLNKIGGLFSLMPWTGITAVVASLSIAGIPPLNGFASKLLIFESSIIAGTEVGAAIWAKALFVILGIAAIFISAVTLASFLKFLNSAFMGKLRGVRVSSMGDVPLSMNVPQGILAFLCVLFGVVPLLPIVLIYKAVSGALPAGTCPASAVLFGKVWPGISVNFSTGITSGVWNPLWVIIAFVIVLGLIYMVVRAGGAKVRKVETWYGGREHIPADVSYRGHSFYMPFKQVFSFKVRGVQFQGLYPTSLPLPKVTMPKGLRLLLNPDQWFYYPIANLFMKINRGLSKSHTGVPQMYLLWIVAGVILTIVIILCIR